MRNQEVSDIVSSELHFLDSETSSQILFNSLTKSAFQILVRHHELETSYMRSQKQDQTQFYNSVDYVFLLFLGRFFVENIHSLFELSIRQILEEEEEFYQREVVRANQSLRFLLTESFHANQSVHKPKIISDLASQLIHVEDYVLEEAVISVSIFRSEFFEIQIFLFEHPAHYLELSCEDINHFSLS